LQPVEKLTDEQRKIVYASEDGRDGDFVVEACPGSGKTRAVAARFVRLARSRKTRSGVAVLSFSNVAAVEVMKRCQELGNSALASFPNFVGTLDAFICRFIVGSFRSPWYDGRPQILDSWARLNLDVRPRGAGAVASGLTLDELDLGPDGNAHLNLDRVERRLREVVRKDVGAWERVAVSKRQRLVRGGLLSCADARWCALQRMDSEVDGPALARALRARFEEVILDEAQDCNEQDWRLVRWLRAAGIRIVVVGDPRQAIFEFRDAQPEAFRALATEVGVRPLTGNFRSTPQICLVSATARANSVPDRAVGDLRNENGQVVLVTYQGRSVPPDVGRVFLARCRQLGIEPAGAAVLAHGARHAHRATGQSSDDERTNGSRVAQMAEAAACLRSEGDPRERLAALGVAERVILCRLGFDVEGMPPERLAEQDGIEPRWLRRAAIGILSRLPDMPSNEGAVAAWTAAAQAVVAAVQPPVGRTWAFTPGRVLPRPAKWAGNAPPLVGAPRPSSVHRAKGAEFEAVLFAIPPHSTHTQSADLVRDWKTRADTERLRVAYVGMSRARRFLMIAVPAAYGDEIGGILRRGGVNVERVDVGNDVVDHRPADDLLVSPAVPVPVRRVSGE